MRFGPIVLAAACVGTAGESVLQFRARNAPCPTEDHVMYNVCNGKIRVHPSMIVKFSKFEAFFAPPFFTRDPGEWRTMKLNRKPVCSLSSNTAAQSSSLHQHDAVLCT